MGDNCLLDNYQPKHMCFSSLACILRMEGFHPLYPNGTPFFLFVFVFSSILFGPCFYLAFVLSQRLVYCFFVFVFYQLLFGLLYFFWLS